MIDKRKNHGRACKLLHGAGLCDLARDGSGDPIKVNKPCAICRERRCKTHCRCGRLKQTTGRKAPRPGSPAAAAKAKAAPKAKAQPKVAAKAAPKAAANAAAAATPLLPLAAPQQRQQRASTTQVSVFSEWHKQLLAEVELASTQKLVILSYCMDEIQLCTALQKKLKPPSKFQCTVVVDRQYFLGRTATHQRPRLHELKEHGATVMLATGSKCGNYQGAMHMKVAAINDDVAFVGSCNWTFSSLANQEICLRLQGHAVQQIHEVVFDVVKTAVLLKDGE